MVWSCAILFKEGIVQVVREIVSIHAVSEGLGGQVLHLYIGRFYRAVA